MRTAFFFLFISSLFFSISCDKSTQTDVNPDELNVGALSFSLAKSAIPSEVKLVAARLERSGYKALKDSVQPYNTVDTVKLRFSNVPIGTWSLTIEAKDSSGIIRYKGTSSLTILESQTTNVVVQMTPVSSGVGNVEIAVVWSSTFSWKMSAENPVLTQTSGSWDADHFFFHTPCVLKINGVYRVWYTTGYSQSVNKTQYEWIAYATSTDGIHWTKRGPVVYPGPVGSWNEKGVIWPTVLYENGKFKMWFGGNSATQFRTGIGYAESVDGIEWSVRAQPVVAPNSQRVELWMPFVLKKDNSFYLYYGTRGSLSDPIDTYLMMSTDGITWAEQRKVLAARTYISWEQNGIVGPRIFYDQNKYRMFYTGYAWDNSISVGYAESADGIQWTSNKTTPVLSSLNTYPWQTAWAAYVSAMKDEGKVKLWFSALTSEPYRWQIGYAEHVE